MFLSCSTRSSESLPSINPALKHDPRSSSATVVFHKPRTPSALLPVFSGFVSHCQPPTLLAIQADCSARPCTGICGSINSSGGNEIGKKPLMAAKVNIRPIMNGVFRVPVSQNLRYPIFQQSTSAAESHDSDLETIPRTIARE